MKLLYRGRQEQPDTDETLPCCRAFAGWDPLRAGDLADSQFEFDMAGATTANATVAAQATAADAPPGCAQATDRGATVCCTCLPRDFCRQLLHDDRATVAELLVGTAAQLPPARSWSVAASACPDGVPPQRWGWPYSPLWHELVGAVLAWLASGQEPQRQWPKLHLLHDELGEERWASVVRPRTLPRLRRVLEALQECARQQQWHQEAGGEGDGGTAAAAAAAAMPCERLDAAVHELLCAGLGVTGVLALLGQRTTAGTVQQCPPPLS